jgi:putative ABC transport system permease protein
LGKTITYNRNVPLKIIGVIHDMLMESPFTGVRPTVFMVNYNNAGIILMKLNPAMSAKQALSKIEPIFKAFNPGSLFEVQFADKEFNSKFINEERIGKLVSFFAVLALFISCLGLFGLASFVAEQRTKEIGIRKVLGATVFNLWQMLSKEFVVLVAVSCLIAIPVALYLLDHWLQQYEYRTTITWWIFAVACACTLVITLLTVSFQAIKASLANPVKSLRTE